MWGPFPMFWTAGLNTAMGATLAAGDTLVMQEMFEPGHARQMMLAGYDPTRFVPTSVNGARSWA